MHNSGHFLPGWVVACESRPDQALSAPCSRDRLTHNDIVATTYLSMSKISASGGEIEGECPRVLPSGPHALPCPTPTVLQL